jgi:hypothetical protein
VYVRLLSSSFSPRGLPHFYFNVVEEEELCLLTSSSLKARALLVPMDIQSLVSGRSRPTFGFGSMILIWFIEKSQELSITAKKRVVLLTTPHF